MTMMTMIPVMSGMFMVFYDRCNIYDFHDFLDVLHDYDGDDVHF